MAELARHLRRLVDTAEHDPTLGLVVGMGEEMAFDELALEHVAEDSSASDSSSSDSDGSMLTFSDDEEELLDTTAEQAAAGRDLQGIPWERLHWTREQYRTTRLANYRNYVNVLPEDAAKYRPELLRRCASVEHSAAFFTFLRNNRAVQLNIVHFQLRNLVWALSRNDVFLVHDNVIKHWSPLTRTSTQVMDLSGNSPAARIPGLGRVQVSTLCVQHDLMAAGGFGGELVVKRLAPEQQQGTGQEEEQGEAAGPLWGDEGQQGAGAAAGPGLGSHRLQQHALRRGGGPHGGGRGAGELEGGEGLGAAGLAFARRITPSDNGITNGLEIFDSLQHGTCVLAANNDCCVRLFDAHTFKCSERWEFPWAVNYASLRPEGHLVAVVGDDPVTELVDMHSGRTVAHLPAHADFSFAAAWHPHGNLLATGNQDTTTVVWDIRNTGAPLTQLAAAMGAVRSLRFSQDGAFLAASEPADFVHIYHVASGFTTAQQIELFGDIAGFSFTPAGDAFFVGIADTTYASLLQYNAVQRSGAHRWSGWDDDVAEAVAARSAARLTVPETAAVAGSGDQPGAGVPAGSRRM